MKNAPLLLLVFWLAHVNNGFAQPTIDGRLAGDEAFYGSPLSVQNTNTHFGDADSGDPINGGRGSEIDQVFARVANNRLHVFVAGNLEPNFNKLEVFVDSKVGGVNTIDGNSLPAGVDAFCCGGFGTTSGALQQMQGLTFDAGFGADYFLSLMHGFEIVNPSLPGELKFWAMTAHYADLTQGVNGAVVPVGMQLAYQGLPNVLRAPGDFANEGAVGAASYVAWRNSQDQAVERGTGADADGSGTVGAEDLAIWRRNFGKGTGLDDFTFAPQNAGDSVSQALLGPALPNLAQGELIDRAYALGPGGCADDAGGCAIRELEFALGIGPDEIGTNQSNHRDFDNSIDLKMAIDNSNTAGVSGQGPYSSPTNDSPQDVDTGIEFSIPLASIGNPTADIRLTIFINGLLHDFASNQFSGEGILLSNLGSLMPDLEFEFSGNQYVTVDQGDSAAAAVPSVPEPAALTSLAVLSLVGVAGRRRAKSRN